MKLSIEDLVGAGAVRNHKAFPALIELVKMWFSTKSDLATPFYYNNVYNMYHTHYPKMKFNSCFPNNAVSKRVSPMPLL